MNRLFLEKIIENQSLLEPLLSIDEKVMGVSVSSQEVLLEVEKLLVSDDSFSYSIADQSLVLSNGDWRDGLKFFTYVNPERNFIYFPNDSFLGLHSFFEKIFVSLYGEHCYLDRSHNYNRYLATKDSFSAIYAVGEEVSYQEMKADFPSLIWLSN